LLPTAALPSTVTTAVQMAATETAKWIVQGKSDTLEGRLITFDTRTFETQAHTLTRRLQCPCCGEPSRSRDHAPRPLRLERRKKRFTDDGGHRSVPPETTLKSFGHHISSLTGVVRRLKRLSDEADPLVHSYAAGHNPASLFEGVGLIRKNLRDISGGKGRTDLQARASGLCEALERYSGIYQGEEGSRVGSYRTLGEDAIHPNDCMGFSERQYRNRAASNAAADSMALWVPAPFDEAQEIAWTPVWSMTWQTFRYLPTAYCYYGYPPEKSPFCRADSNGNAAGNTLEEAILQGFMELVERDSVALWWYNRVALPGVDLDSFQEPYFDALRAYYRSVGRELWVMDLTSDLEIPVFVALSRRTDHAREDILFGFGAHFDARLAISRALTEMNQVLPTVLHIEEDRHGRPIHPDRLAMQWWEEATLENQPYLTVHADVPPKAAADYPRCWSDDLLDDIQTCAEIVEQKGMELLVLDQTQPDVGLPVVKVIVPGLRHFWPRFGPGRLYEVPVRQGWLQEALDEQRLNPFPLFC
jgi:thiazole/oxazole-forming peptide maturase SagD family component